MTFRIYTYSASILLIAGAFMGGGIDAAAASTTSASGTSIPSAAQITDSGANVWTVSAGVVHENGALAGYTSGVTRLLYDNKVIYQENSSGGWWAWNGSNWASSSDPRKTPSANGTSIPAATQITDGSGNVWTVSAGVIFQNGVMAGSSNAVTQLVYEKGVIYQENSAGGWWSWTGSTWAASPNPVSSWVTATNNTGACLPITMPSTAALFSSPKRVFAHYFAPFPLQVNNVPASQDYYNTQYLSRSGESDKWVAQGGYLRARPLALPVNPAADWLLLNMEQEVRMAIARGITGFTFDVMGVSEAVGSGSQLQTLLQAAQAVDSRFKIVVMPDITALGSNAAAVVQVIAAVAASPAAYRLADGKLVVSSFDAELNSPAWWLSVFSTLNAKGIDVAFIPTFLNWTGSAPTFSSVTYGFGDWGTATAASAAGMQGDPAIAHGKYGHVFMMPIESQQYRPKDFVYWEAGNSATLRDSWTSAIQGGADFVQMVTWSDFSESGQVEPSTDATLNPSIGTGFYDLTGYYAAWYLTGQQPAITHDVLYYFYRREPTTAAASAQSQLDKNASGTAEDDIEVVAFLTAPGVVEITIGGQTYSENAPAGVSSYKVPLQPGTPVFALSRNNAAVFSFQGGVQIYGHSGIPSGVLDLTYWSGSASATGICAL
jgi:hypothetical protein